MDQWNNQGGAAYGRNNGRVIEPREVKVLNIVFDPLVKARSGRTLLKAMGWNAVDMLTSRYVADLLESSHGYARYSIVNKILVGSFPVQEDGYRYDGAEFMGMMRKRRGFHPADQVDYQQILSDFHIIEMINSGDVDEVWMFGPPYAGFYESRMAGPGAFFCNAPPLRQTEKARRRFIIMGFNYERGVGEMLESFGHRAESIMRHVYREHKGEDNLWERFTRYEITYPGESEVGTVHFAPNSLSDYDWGNRRKVLSRCRTWVTYPDLNGDGVWVDCQEWGGGDMRLHHKWWLSHFPHTGGINNQVSNNWWKYVVDPNRV